MEDFVPFEIMDLEHDYPSSNEELIKDFNKLHEEI